MRGGALAAGQLADGIDPFGEHGAPGHRDIQDVARAFVIERVLALQLLDDGIGALAHRRQRHDRLIARTIGEEAAQRRAIERLGMKQREEIAHGGFRIHSLYVHCLGYPAP